VAHHRQLARPWPLHSYSSLPTASSRAPGAIDAERVRVPGLVQFLEREGPRLIAFNKYANTDGTEVTVVQVHPDAESMTVHMQAVRERATRAYEETLDTNVSSS
jgi:hypothetical protein